MYQPKMIQDPKRQYEVFRGCMSRVLKRREFSEYLQEDSPSKEKLSKLTVSAFNELVCDVTDEIIRREVNDPDVTFLPPENRFIDKRNHARKKLATLSTRKMEELGYEVLRDLDNRTSGKTPSYRRIPPQQNPVQEQKLMSKQKTPQKLVTDSLGISERLSNLNQSDNISSSAKSQTGRYEGNYSPGERMYNSLDTNDQISMSDQRNSRKDSITSQQEKNMLMLRMDLKEIKMETQKLRGAVKEMEAKVEMKSNEVARLSRQVEELRIENMNTRNMVSNQAQYDGSRALKSNVGQSAEQKIPPAQEARDSERDRLKLKKKYTDQPKTNGAIIQMFVDTSDELLDSARSNSTSSLINKMKTFVMKLKDITNEALSVKKMCITSDKLDELQACEEYVMVSSGGLVDIVKTLSSEKGSGGDVDITEIESSLEVTKNSIFLLAKLVRQILLTYYESDAQSSISKEEMENMFSRWVIAGGTISQESDLATNVLPKGTRMRSAGNMKMFLEEKISNIVPIIKNLISMIKEVPPEIKELDQIMEDMFSNVCKIVSEVESSANSIPQDIREGVMNVAREMSNTNDIFSSNCRSFIKLSDREELIPEISSDCYQIAKQLKELFNYF